MRSATTETRPYHSPRRRAQAEKTRELIVEAIVEQLGDSGRTDFSVAEIAARAGVAVRTVYRYFPTREDMLRAIDELYAMDHRVQPQGDPWDIHALSEHLTLLFGWFDENPRLVEAAHVTQLGREVRGVGRKRRLEAMRREIDTHLHALDGAERRRAAAVFATMFGSQTWRTMRHELGMRNDEAIAAVTWVARLVMQDLQRQVKRAGRKRR